MDITADVAEGFALFLRRLLAQPESATFVNKAAGWVRTAELRHVLTWSVPLAKAWSEVPEVRDYTDGQESRWLADRFLLTFVSDWSTSSLHHEFRWMRGEAPSKVDPNELALRVVPDEKLNAEIAMRAVTGQGGEYQRSLLSRAVELLEARQFSAAAALFEGALAVSPTDWVRSCLAFCLIPIEPLSAIQILDELLAEGFDPPLLRKPCGRESRERSDR